MRLKRHFDYIFSGSRRVESHAFRIHFREPLFSSPSVAFVATKKQGCAVKRNRSKRRLRELYRQSPVISIIASDMVIITKPAVLNWNFEALAKDFDRLLGRVCHASPPESATPTC